MYEQKSRLFNYYVRFWKDGTVENISGKADDAAERLAHTRGESLYSMDGCTFQIEARFAGGPQQTHTGNVAGENQIRITSENGGFWSAGTYEFIPVDFESVEKKAAEQRKEALDKANAELHDMLGGDCPSGQSNHE